MNNINDTHMDKWERRKFISAMIATGACAAFIPLIGKAVATPTDQLTVQQVMDIILKDIPGAPFKQTVDTLKSGKPEQLVSGIITTMFATASIINKAVATGSNFIIAHEPTFYNHT